MYQERAHQKLYLCGITVTPTDDDNISQEDHAKEKWAGGREEEVIDIEYVPK